MPFENFGEGILPLKKSFIDETPKGTSLGQSAWFEALCVQIGSVVWSVGRQKKKKGKKVKSIYAYISPIWGAAPSQPIVTIFGNFSGLAEHNQPCKIS
jgi:hypothetical protein